MHLNHVGALTASTTTSYLCRGRPVERAGLEPATPCLQSRSPRASRASALHTLYGSGGASGAARVRQAGVQNVSQTYPAVHGPVAATFARARVWRGRARGTLAVLGVLLVAALITLLAGCRIERVPPQETAADRACRAHDDHVRTLRDGGPTCG